MRAKSNNLSLVVVGGSGDLARKKIFPALFALYSQDALPRNFQVFAFSRSPFAPDTFRARIQEHLTCRYVPDSSCNLRVAEFLARCHYVQGNYGSRESFLDLFDAMRAKESDPATNRLFYLAIPPSIFLDVAHAIGGAGLVNCGPEDPWSRVVIEKPFGRDRESSDLLTREMNRVFTESQTYRIDHYLGKEVIQNLMVLRFANLVFEPIWNRQFIESVHILWKEDVGVADRGGYFDDYGIVRDVVQNHMLQILALVAMERPLSTASHDVRNQKVAVLRRIAPLVVDDLALGQYAANTTNGASHPAYTSERSVPALSTAATFVTAVLGIQCPRWDGVPFFITAGKALDERRNEVQIRFRRVPDNLFCRPGNPECLPANTLVIRIQPDEAINLNIINKRPGLGVSLVESPLNLRYQAAFQTVIPDAYERLILDVIHGDKSLFIRSDELEAAWDIFTPALHEIERLHIRPALYPFGSSGPDICRTLRELHGLQPE